MYGAIPYRPPCCGLLTVGIRLKPGMAVSSLYILTNIFYSIYIIKESFLFECSKYIECLPHNSVAMVKGRVRRLNCNSGESPFYRRR